MRIGSLMAMVRSLMAEGRRVSPAVLATIGKGPQTSLRYPEWRSVRKTRGRRDASQRQLSNRRKAAARG
jgi:hypothetical protein